MYRVATPDDRTGADEGPRWTNRLVHEKSPYLLQHAHNPVDWYPWGEEAFERARTEDAPLLLSIGYSACHWCHVMERESFEDPEVAAYLNTHFVPVKVDREERPDVDAIYIEALVALQGTAGWPANLFLLGDLRPFAGGTYFPPDRRHGLPSFREVLERVRSFWDEQRPRLLQTGQSLQVRLGRPPPPNERLPDRGGYRRAIGRVIAQHDPEHGGLGDGQKFPQTPTVELLLLGAADGRPQARETLARSLRAMAHGGLRDPLGGGFHRYCVDRQWTVPHFEKMLYDNAQLLRVYARAASLFADTDPDLAEECLRVTRETADYLLLDLRHPSGAFCSSEDADDPGGEGTFYTFTAAEAREALGLGPTDPLPYGITEEGNFEGRTVLSTWSDRTGSGRPPEAVRQALLEARNRRQRPAPDDKRIVAWNGLTLGALAEAGRLHGFQDWIAAAARCAEIVLRARTDRGTLPRLLDGRAPGTLEDQAFVVEGLLDLYQARPHEPRWLDAAQALATQTVADFGSEQGGFFQSRPRQDLILRRRDFQDGAEPSGNGRMADSLRRLIAYGAPVEREILDTLVHAASGLMTGYPTATPTLWAVTRGLSVPPLESGPPSELVIAGDPADPTTQQLLRVWNRRWRPQGVVAVVPPDAPASDYTLLEGKTPAPEGAPRAYPCRLGSCSAPVSTPEALAAALGEP